MASLLEGVAPTHLDQSVAAEFYLTFILFHARWLIWCVRSGHLELIPEILAIVQGRELAAEVLDQLNLNNPETPQEVRAFHQLRLELRKINARIEAVINGGKAPGTPGLQGIGRASLPAATWDREGYAELIAEQRCLADQIPALRRAAAQTPGYEYLELPYQPLPLADVQQRLAEREALVLLIHARGDPGVLVIFRQGSPRWQSVPELPTLALAVRRFDGADESVRGYRRGIAAAVAPCESVELEIKEKLGRFGEGIVDAFRRSETFWDSLAQAMEHFLWAPLKPHLKDTHLVTAIPHGELHLLPLATGLPTDLELCQFPGLAFFVQRRGIHAPWTGPVATTEGAVGLIGFVGQNGDIPLAEAETAALAALYRERQTPAAHPSRYPRAKEPLALLHIACHGIPDPENPARVALDLGGQHDHAQSAAQVLNQSAIIDSDTVPLDVYFSACLGGQTVEGLSGSPSGLVSACFRRNVRWVVGSLVSIPDQWAMLLALLTHQALVRNLPLPVALAEGKRRLTEGEWYPDTAGRLRAVLTAPLCQLFDRGGQDVWEKLTHYCDPTELPRQFSDRAVPALLQGWGLDDAELTDLHNRLRDHGPETLAKPLAQVLAELWPSRPRIPMQPALSTLVNGLVVFGGSSK